MDFPLPLSVHPEDSTNAEELHEDAAPARALELRRPLAAFSKPRRKELFPRSWPRHMASLAQLKWAWLAFRRGGLPKDLRRLLLWTYLGSFFFHLESDTLRKERILMSFYFENFARQKNLMKCVRFETIFLALESGNLLLSRDNRDFTRHHASPYHLTPCFHHGIWARVRHEDVARGKRAD